VIIYFRDRDKKFPEKESVPDGFLIVGSRDGGSSGLENEKMRFRANGGVCNVVGSYKVYNGNREYSWSQGTVTRKVSMLN